jgi:CRP/FNR family transcriptional regulator, cyclic AMP receptor protein
MSSEYDMRQMARGTGKSVAFTAGSTVFTEGDAGTCMYVVQSGVVEMVTHDKVVEIVEPNGAIGYMSMIDGRARSSTARVKENCELTELDARKFRFMVDEVPHFAQYIMQMLAGRIRGMGKAM